MKIKNVIITLTGLLLFNSCIIKSLQPFYTSDAIAFQESFVGEWEDENKALWQILAVKDLSELLGSYRNNDSKEDIEFFKAYKNAYLVTYKKEEKIINYIAMPFKVNNQLFLDFTPFNKGSRTNNSLTGSHFLATHSLAKFDILDNKNISIKWLSESRIEKLLENNEIRIKHEKVGPLKDLVLTATSEELMTFVEKYSKSTIEDKWKSSSKLNLKKIDVKP